MPSKSKAQQRFMGLVHAFNKGDVKGSEVSKKVKDVAKGMKKSDVKKYASTKHKGKPEKVKKEAIDKIREMIRMELEGCGYVMSAKNPSYKLKSPGGTGEEDKKLKEKIKNTETGFRWKQIPNRGTINFGEYGKYLILNKTKMFVDGKWISGRLKGKKVRWYSKDGQRDARKRKGIPISKTPHFPFGMVKESILSEGEKEKIEQLLIKYGNTPEDAKQMIKKTYDYIKKAYRNANASKKAEIMSSLMKFETMEQFSNLVEKCWKGYMIHPKRKTKKLFGKTYPNCIKKEAVDKQQGTTILNQLGGKRFIMFTGAKHFGVGKEGLSFKIGRNSKQVNHIKIDYDRGRDLYNMKFDWVTKKGIKTKKEVKGVYADMLQDVFSRHTGMATRF